MSAVVRDERITDMLDRRARQPGRSPIEVVVDRIWRFLCSVRAAVYEIVFLALLVLIGTLKGSIIPAQIPRFVPALDPFVARWYAFDVFRSPIFSGTLALLAVAIVVCTANRVPGIWASIAHPTIATTRQFFESAIPAARFTIPDGGSVAAQQLSSLLRQRRYRVLQEQHEGAIHLYADKNRFGKLGTFPFHLGLILVLVGGIVGAQLGFREQMFTVPEGAVRDVGHGTGLRVQLDSFTDTYNELGAVTEYRSDLVLYDGDREVRRQSIRVNQPLTYGTVTFYQTSYGQAAQMRVTDSAGNLVYDDAVEFTFLSRTNKDAPAAKLDLPSVGRSLELIFPNLKLNDTPEIGTTRIAPGQVFVQVRDLPTNTLMAEGAAITQGDSAVIGDLTVQFVREQRFTLLQVASNPGIPILFAASLFGVLGLMMTFFLPHRRLRILIRDTDGSSEVLMAPMARRDWAGQRDFVASISALESRWGSAEPYGRMLREQH